MLGIIEDDPFLPIKKLIKEGFGLPEPKNVKAMSGGLINETYDIDGIWVLQWVNPVFGAAVNDDIAALVPILQKRGVCVPLLCAPAGGGWSVDGADFGLKPGRWRLMTMLSGTSRDSAGSIEQICSLTRALARFHGALNDCHYVFKHQRPCVHEFMRHYRALEQVLETDEYRTHRLYQKVSELFEKIKALSKFVDFDSVMACEDLRIIHGDPKISNFLMKDDDVVGIVDLDTMARSRVSFDIGDAIRSWCNPRREDEEPAYNREYAREVLGLYMEEAPFLTRSERESLPSSSAFISLELSMRFARDAIREDYFGFNPEIGHGEHSLMRAEAMYLLCNQML